MSELPTRFAATELALGVRYVDDRRAQKSIIFAACSQGTVAQFAGQRWLMHHLLLIAFCSVADG